MPEGRRRSDPEKDEGVIPVRKRPRYAGVHGSIRATAKEQAEAEREGREVGFDPEQHGANPWTDFDIPKPDEAPPASRKRPPGDRPD